MLRVAAVDDGGNVWAVPEQWHAETPPPRLRIIEHGKDRFAVGDSESHHGAAPSASHAEDVGGLEVAACAEQLGKIAIEI